MLTRGGLRFVTVWSAVILLFYALGGYAGVRQLQYYKTETEKTRLAAIGGAPAGPDAQPSGSQLTQGRKPVEVTTGININHIGEFSVKESGWAADFDIWFRWTGNGISPGESFRVVNGEVDSREKIEAYLRNGERYERYRVKARLMKFFDPDRFPFSDETLVIQIEDAVHGPETLRYIADETDSGINSSGIPGYLKIEKTAVLINTHDYGSRLGKTGLSNADTVVRSRLVFIMLVYLPSTAGYLRMSQALFASVAIAFIVFFIKPIYVDPRFGLGIGAVFAAVANNISVQAALPPPVQVTLLQMVYAVGLITIFLTLVQSAISLYILDTLGNERLYRLFDKASFTVFLAGYTAVNLALPIAASV
jgi:hypothetical protein